MREFRREDAFRRGAGYENSSALCGLGGVGLGSGSSVEDLFFFGYKNQRQRFCGASCALLAVIFGCWLLMTYQAQFRVFGGEFWGAAVEASSCNTELRMSSAS